MIVTKEFHCVGCGRLLGKVNSDGELEVVHRGQKVLSPKIVWCPKCGAVNTNAYLTG